MAKRVKPALINSAAEFELVLDEIALDLLERDQLCLNRETAIAAVRDEAAPAIEAIEGKIKLALASAERFATVNRATLLPGEAKSEKTTLAEWGFRNSTKSLVLLDAWKWPDVVNAIQAHLAELHAEFEEAELAEDNERLCMAQAAIDKWEGFLVTTTEVVKDPIKTELTDDERASIGTKLRQGESFWVEPKREKDKPLTVPEPPTETNKGAA